MTKSKNKRTNPRKNTTRKNAIRKITFSSDYVLEDSEKDIPLNVYTPIRLPVPEDNISEEHRNAYSITRSFIASQTETDDTFSVSVKYKMYITEVIVGLARYGCVIITIQKVDWYDHNSFIEATINVKHHEYCNILHNLQKGKGTIVMVRTAISFALTYFKIDKFRLKDMGQINCNDTYQISLPALYLLKHGMTWYQKHIGVHIYNTQLLKRIENYKQFVATKPKWEYLYNTYILPELRKYKRDNEDRENILENVRDIKIFLYEKWNNADNYRDFIGSIVSDEQQCSYLMNWFNQIFFDIVDQQFYGEADNFILYADFPFINGLAVTYVKIDDVKNKKLIGGYTSRIIYPPTTDGTPPVGVWKTIYDPFLKLD
jgi:hypothetical protein